MLPSRSRYTLKQLRSLGYSGPDDGYPVCIASDNRDDIDAIVKGKFKNIIDVIFDSNDGSLQNKINDLVSENSPASVRMFVQNFLFQPVEALQSAPDDQSALDMLIPRSVQTSAELAPYISSLTKMVGDAIQKSKDNDSN